MAWFYPYAATNFNPVVVDDVMYTLGRGNSLIALDATTGKEIWTTRGSPGSTARREYWQSEDGKDRRLMFSINSFLQEIDARYRQDHPEFRRDGIVDSGTGARAEQSAGRIQSTVREGLEEYHNPGSAPGKPS